MIIKYIISSKCKHTLKVLLQHLKPGATISIPYYGIIVVLPAF